MIKQSSSFIEFEADDLEERSANSLAEYLQVSRAFVQLCYDSGFPVGTGAASAAELLGWLSGHYPRVREVAGLSPLDAHPARTLLTANKVAWANAVSTLLEFGLARSSKRCERSEMRAQKRRLDRALARARIARKRRDQKIQKGV